MLRDLCISMELTLNWVEKEHKADIAVFSILGGSIDLMVGDLVAVRTLL